MATSLRSARLLTLGRLTLLGADGQEDRELATRKRKLALLAVLALSPHPLTRDALIEMFWGDQPEERARHSLSDALSHLRRVLGSDAITQRRSEVGLSETLALVVDARELHEAARRQRWDDVVAMYGGPFLDAVYVGGSSRFEQWVDGERRRASNVFATAAKAECDRLFRAREFDACALLARRWLDESPSSPHAASFALRAQAADDSPEGAQRALDEYARITRVLQDELGARPDVMVAALAQEIAAGLAARQASAPTPTPAPPSTTPEAVGIVVPAPESERSTSVTEASPVAGNNRIATRPTAVADGDSDGVIRGRWFRRLVPAAAAAMFGAWIWSARASAPSAPVAETPVVLSTSPEAAALYTRATTEYQRDGNRERAVARLDSAIRLDSTFALAYRRLASIYGSGIDDRHRMVFALTKAVELSDRLPPQERLLALGSYHTTVTHDYARAAGVYRELLATAPTEARAWSNLGVVYDYLGDRRRAAEAYERSLALNPKRINPLMNLADARYDLGDVAGAWRALDSIAVHFPGHPSLFMRTAAVAHSEGDTARAEAQLRALIASAPDNDYLQSAGHMLLAKALWSYGRLADGDSVRRVGIAHDRARGARDAVLVGLLEMSQLDVWARHDLPRAKRELQGALREVPLASLDPLDRPYLDLAMLQALTGDVRAAMATYDAYLREVPAMDRRDRTAAERRARGVLLVAESRTREGIAALRSATDPLCSPCGLPELAWAYLQAGQADSARQVHARYVALRSSRKLDVTDGFHRVRIGRALRERGGTGAE